MRILNLLEGSEKLFHTCPIVAGISILRSGELHCSVVDKVEDEAMSNKLGISDAIYFYLSLARSLSSDFSTGRIARGSIVAFEVDGRKLSRYGRVLPFHFFDGGSATDEMEDRLVTSHPFIKLDSGVITGVRIMCDSDDLLKFRNIVDWSFPVLFYTRGQDFLLGRNGKTFSEMSVRDGLTIEVGINSKSNMVFADTLKLVNRYLDGDDFSDAEYVDFKKKLHYNLDMFKYVLTNAKLVSPGLATKFVKHLKKYGIRPAGMEKFIRVIYEMVSAKEPFDHRTYLELEGDYK